MAYMKDLDPENTSYVSEQEEYYIINEIDLKSSCYAVILKISTAIILVVKYHESC